MLREFTSSRPNFPVLLFLKSNAISLGRDRTFLQDRARITLSEFIPWVVSSSPPQDSLRPLPEQTFLPAVYRLPDRATIDPISPISPHMVFIEVTHHCNLLGVRRTETSLIVWSASASAPDRQA